LSDPAKGTNLVNNLVKSCKQQQRFFDFSRVFLIAFFENFTFSSSLVRLASCKGFLGVPASSAGAPLDSLNIQPEKEEEKLAF